MLNLLALLLRQHRRTRQNKLSKAIRMINTMPNRIPKPWHILPFVNEPRRISIKQPTDFRFRQHQILIALLGIPHIEHTLGNLLASGCLPTPLRAFYNNSPNRLKPFRQNAICDSFSIFRNHRQIILNYADQRQLPFGSLDHFHSAVWTISVRQFGHPPPPSQPLLPSPQRTRRPHRRRPSTPASTTVCTTVYEMI